MTEEKTSDKPETKAEDIEKSGAITTEKERGAIHAIIIAGQIEGHYTLGDQTKTTKYEQCIPQLVAVEESEKIGGLLVLLNTMGGDVPSLPLTPKNKLQKSEKNAENKPKRLDFFCGLWYNDYVGT